MTLTIEEEVESSFDFEYRKLAEDVVLTAMKAERFPFEAEVNLFLVSSEEIRAINQEYRQVNAPTDVLSFPMIHYHHPGDFSQMEQEEDNFNPDTEEALLGDIVLCVDRVKEQAKRFGHSEKREYAFLILHSMLHLFGYDHMTQEEAAVMEEKQNKILNQMGIYR